MDAKAGDIREFGTLTMPEVVWDRAKSISAVIAPLAAQVIAGRAAVDAAALPLGVSPRPSLLWTWFADGFGPRALLWRERGLAFLGRGRSYTRRHGMRKPPFTCKT